MEDIDLRYWYSGGLGNFTLKVNPLDNTFYAIAVKVLNERPFEGVNEITVNLNKLKKEIKSVKTTNYLINSIIYGKAQSQNCYMGIFTDREGNLLECPTSNIGFILKDNSFCVPPFDKTIQGTTVMRLFEYVNKELINKNLITRISREYLTLEQVREKAKEALIMGGDFVIPILKIDDLEISKTPGDITKLFQLFLSNDKIILNSKYEEIPKFENEKINTALHL